MLPLEAIAVPYLLKLIFYLIAFNRLAYREIELIALTLMTSSKTREPADNVISLETSIQMIKDHSDNEQTLSENNQI